MNQDKFNSLVRELVTAVGTAAGSFGLMHDNLIVAVSGFVVAAAMVGWALYTHSDTSILGTLLRKALSSGAGVAVTYGVITPEKAEAILGVVLVIISIYFGNRASGPATPGDGNSNGGLNALLMLLACSFMIGLNSCAGLLNGISFTPDGCVMADFNSPEFGKYKAGICYEKDPGPDGKRDIDRYVVLWNEPGTGNEFKATRYINDPRDLVIEYKSGGVWVTWDSKAGLMPVFPPEVNNPPAEVVNATSTN
jgi:hypothetical protein